MSNAKKPLVSLIVPGYNEEILITKNLGILHDFMKDQEEVFDWELIFINDGSKDKTGILADEFAIGKPNIKIVHHVVNLNLGNALKTGFAHARGEFVITYDLDLSYDPDHIRRLFDTLYSTKADLVLASPYMPGGKVTAVPFSRKIMSKWVNKFMRMASQDKYHTYTGMVRGYKTSFLQGLNLKTKDYEINPEILYKSMILRARIIEIPAHLDWTEQNKYGEKRTSGMRVLKTFFSGLMAGFIFRPYIFFVGIGILLFIISLYLIGWITYNTYLIYPSIHIDPKVFDDRFSMAIGMVFKQRPHAFFVGGITLIAAIQILSLGFISLQNKRYFEEMFHINTSVLKEIKNKENSSSNEIQ
jgi:glycosyltransferase involved in cell wall biosynthesis